MHKAMVMFLHVSVSHSVHGRGFPPMHMDGGVCGRECTLRPPPTPPPPRWPLRQSVRILLECMLVMLMWKDFNLTMVSTEANQIIEGKLKYINYGNMDGLKNLVKPSK